MDSFREGVSIYLALTYISSLLHYSALCICTRCRIVRSGSPRGRVSARCLRDAPNLIDFVKRPHGVLLLFMLLCIFDRDTNCWCPSQPWNAVVQAYCLQWGMSLLPSFGISFQPVIMISDSHPRGCSVFSGCSGLACKAKKHITCMISVNLLFRRYSHISIPPICMLIRSPPPCPL
jgi:hypothetical protein